MALRVKTPGTAGDRMLHVQTRTPGQCTAAEPDACTWLAPVARHTIGGGAGRAMAALARCLIHSATTGGTPPDEVPLTQRVTTLRSHPSCSANVEAVQPKSAMQARSCCDLMEVADTRQNRTKAS